jgi:hypothetical protein
LLQPCTCSFCEAIAIKNGPGKDCGAARSCVPEARQVGRIVADEDDRDAGSVTGVRQARSGGLDRTRVVPQRWDHAARPEVERGRAGCYSRSALPRSFLVIAVPTEPDGKQVCAGVVSIPLWQHELADAGTNLLPIRGKQPLRNAVLDGVERFPARAPAPAHFGRVTQFPRLRVLIERLVEVDAEPLGDTAQLRLANGQDRVVHPTPC